MFLKVKVLLKSKVNQFLFVFFSVVFSFFLSLFLISFSSGQESSNATQMMEEARLQHSPYIRPTGQRLRQPD